MYYNPLTHKKCKFISIEQLSLQILNHVITNPELS
jgi:hypothetical protein